MDDNTQETISFTNEQLKQVKKINIGKYVYAINRKRDESGLVIDRQLGECLGQIKDISKEGICTLYNRNSQNTSTISIIELTKDWGSNYILSTHLQ